MYSFFKKIFGNSNKDESSYAPANAKLINLINEYARDNKYENYKNIVAELTEGDADLFLPVYNQTDAHISKWTPSPEGYSIKSAIYFVDELTTVATFTSKETLFAWAKKTIPYIELFSKTVVEMCEANEVKQIVIDGKLSIMLTSKNDE